MLKFIPFSDLATLTAIWSTTPCTGRQASNPASSVRRRWSRATWSRTTARPGCSRSGRTAVPQQRAVLAIDCVASIKRWGVRDLFGHALMARTDELSAPDDKIRRETGATSGQLGGSPNRRLQLQFSARPGSNVRRLGRGGSVSVVHADGKQQSQSSIRGEVAAGGPKPGAYRNPSRMIRYREMCRVSRFLLRPHLRLSLDGNDPFPRSAKLGPHLRTLLCVME